MTAHASDERHRLDGNAAAGMLQEVFAVEMTSAARTCADCGRVSAVGALLLYGGSMGCVLRCPGCDALLLCVTSGPAGHTLELRSIVRVAPGEARSRTREGDRGGAPRRRAARGGRPRGRH